MGNVSTTADNNPFGKAPFEPLQRLSVFRTDDPNVRRRIALVILTCWAPLAVLVGIGSLVRGDSSAASFLRDFGTHARYLIAAPLFIFAEPFCLPRLQACVRGFLESDLIGEADRDRYRAAVASLGGGALRAWGLGIVVLAYALVALLYRYALPPNPPFWRTPQGQESVANALATGWVLLVSQPILFILLLGWVWRQLRWAQFLWRTSQLDLRLVPSHPDLMGGLNFVTTTLRGYGPLAIAMGSMIAGALAIRVAQGGVEQSSVRYLLGAFLTAVLLLFAAPLVVFRRNLLSAKARGKFEYGALASGVGIQFERKWLGRPVADEEALGMPDFSAATDLNQVAGNVYQMKHLPIGIKDLGPLVLGSLVPFVPVALAAIPPAEVARHLKQLANLLL